MRVLYFAWLRERLGKTNEELTLPLEIDTPRAVIKWLSLQSAAYEKAFTDIDLIRCAVDQEFCSFDTKLNGASEIAFFPPFTGG